MYYTMVCYTYYGHTNYNSTSVARNVLRCLMLMKEASIISCAWCRVRVWVRIGLGLGFGFGSVPRAG